ncbi:Hypothetical Protein FCC1311_037162 [Hondaea fermentalgiana]|uniref:Uncharacterized protein n=1 Tax=Hondaea fermentalgiana TaxID=2315210 RepID=A0A2R5GFT0_9STRA|nr:Hypothetical Protein FCC1311_037162 [Hondaea fermentalgiana]|eukprot:GBG27493.1 Hypothetical Protein FCC1311_037162 [Hondaea fermentalgiana]
MGACETSADCGRHGSCEQSTCICDTWWTGKADMLSYDGYRCTNFEIAEAAIWAVALLSSIRLFFNIIRAFRLQARSYAGLRARAVRKGSTLPPWKFVPFRILFSGILAPPVLIAIAAPKAFLLEDRELGRAWSVSVLFVIAVPYGFITNFLAEMNTLDTLLKNLTNTRPEDIAKLRRNLRFRNWSAVSLYAGITAVTVLFGCHLEDTPPQDSPMRYMLVIRNCSLIVFMQALGLIARTAAEQGQHLLNSMSATAQTQSKSSRKVEAFLKHLEDMSHEKIKLAKVSTLIYVVFSLPWLWPYQTYPIAIVIIKITGKAHFVHNFLSLPQRSKYASIKVNSVLPSSAASVATTHANQQTNHQNPSQRPPASNVELVKD